MFPLTVRNLRTDKCIDTKFCVKLGHYLTERHKMLQVAYGDKILPQAETFQGFRHLKGGREDVKDDLSSEQPKITSN